MLVQSNTDTRVDDRKRHNLICLLDGLATRSPTCRNSLDPKRHRTFRGELERIGQQILQDLLKPLHIRDDRLWSILPNLDSKLETFGAGYGLEGLQHEFPK